MISSQEALIRNKITGVLVQQARVSAGRSTAECAMALSRDPTFIERAEEGQEELTLPQLESLARVLGVPLDYLLGEQELHGPATLDPSHHDQLMTLRRKIIGVILQQARTDQGRVLADIASVLGCEPERLERIEWGEEPLPLVELEVLAQTLNIPIEAFFADDPSPAPQEEPEGYDAAQQLEHLPPDVQEFVIKPINLPYLQVAMNLSHMPAETLRQIASGLFEITY